MVRQGVKHLINSCKGCGRKYIPNLEGDDKNCDYCLAEYEINDKLDDDKDDKQ